MTHFTTNHKLLGMTCGVALFLTGFVHAHSPYIAGGIGFNNIQDKVTFSDKQNYFSSGSAIFSRTGLKGTVYGGYESDVTNVLNIAAEFFGDYQSSDSYFIDPSVGASLKQNYDYGIRVLPAVEVIPGGYAHILIGWVYANFKLHDNGALITPIHPFAANLNGYQVGFGGTMQLANNVYLRTDVIYSGFQNFINTASVSTRPKAPLDLLSYQNTAASLSGMASVLYKFNL